MEDPGVENDSELRFAIHQYVEEKKKTFVLLNVAEYRDFTGELKSKSYRENWCGKQRLKRFERYFDFQNNLRYACHVKLMLSSVLRTIDGKLQCSSLCCTGSNV